MAKLAIIGTGFVGASLGLALKPSRLFDRISGYDVKADRLQTAVRVGAIDEPARNARAAVEQAAVVLLAVPEVELPDLFREIRGSVVSGCILSDTATWKLPAAEAATALPEEVYFIGGHPILDSTGSGPEQANARALENAVYCLTAGPDTNEAAVNAMSTVVMGAGAQPYYLTPEEHDSLAAGPELLPRTVIAGLAAALVQNRSWTEAGKLADSGLAPWIALTEQTDRLFWHYAKQNGPALARWIDSAVDELLNIRDRLTDDDERQVIKAWEEVETSIGSWRSNKRQLRESTMPPMSELRPNFFGSKAALSRLRGSKGSEKQS